MQNRMLKKYKANLEKGDPIAVLVPDRVFRNEDLDPRHEHTFYQLEGIYVDKSIHAGHLIATLKTFLSEYYQQDLEIKTQPFYFPFTEPSAEFDFSCFKCGGAGCRICKFSGWIELGGSGMVHPNVLRGAGVDPEKPLDDQHDADLLWIREPFLSDARNYGRLIVHGHTPMKTGKPDLRANRLNLDTGAVYGRALTAAVFTDGETNPVAFLQAAE